MLSIEDVVNEIDDDAKMKSQGTTKVITIHSKEDINVSTKFNGSPFNSR